MSNKSQLQTNNTNLDALITRVNAVKDTAASLPEAGGGSGSGGGTVTVAVSGMPEPDADIYYLDSNMEIQNEILMKGGTFEIATNTLFVSTSGGAPAEFVGATLYATFGLSGIYQATG